MKSFEVKTIPVNAPSKSGEVLLGAGCVKSCLPRFCEGQKNFVVTDSNVYALYKPFFEECFKDTEIFVMPAGEEHKTFQTLEEGLKAMLSAGLLRSSKLFAVGGGVVGDMGGLLSALYMRGIACVQIPTTLLSQVDSSVGGKTAVDFGGVKNAVGAFHEPTAVLVDSCFLDTLPSREWLCGLGEIIKYAFLDGELFEKLYEGRERLTDKAFLLSTVERCLRLKIAVVEADEREVGERKSLNLGHTTGHALELLYELSHGEAVLHGLRAETRIAMQAGVCEKEYGNRLLELVDTALRQGQGLPEAVNCVQMARLAKSDKKNSESETIVMAVAKAKGEWALLSLSVEEYQSKMKEALA